MWIFTPNSMLSFVAHRQKPEHLMVRARLRGDIERVFPRAAVTRTPAADYLYRATVTREEAAQALAEHALTMTYPNVKGAIAYDDKRRSSAMGRVWSVMYETQHQAEPWQGHDEPEDHPPMPLSAGERRRLPGERHNLHSGDCFAHTTDAGEARVVVIHQVQTRSDGEEPDVALEFAETQKRFTIPYSRAQDWLRHSERLP